MSRQLNRRQNPRPKSAKRNQMVRQTKWMTQQAPVSLPPVVTDKYFSQRLRYSLASTYAGGNQLSFSFPVNVSPFAMGISSTVVYTLCAAVRIKSIRMFAPFDTNLTASDNTISLRYTPQNGGGSQPVDTRELISTASVERPAYIDIFLDSEDPRSWMYTTASSGIGAGTPPVVNMTINKKTSFDITYVYRLWDGASNGNYTVASAGVAVLYTQQLNANLTVVGRSSQLVFY